MSRRRKTSDSSPFDTLRLEGGLFVAELLERAARGGAPGQDEADYGVPKGLKLHDEYGRSYRIATALWKDFAARMPREDADSHRTTLYFVRDLLRDTLGYSDLDLPETPVALGDRAYPLQAFSPGGRVPVVVAPHDLALDEPDARFAIQGSGARRKSPHQLAQEFLNASPDSTWAIVANGKTLRLLRDAETLTRPNFLEFDIETILREGEDRYADFSALWRILHATRSRGTPCLWEKWKTEGQAQGLRVREGLRDGVQAALIALGTGFVAHPANVALRERLQDGSLSAHAFFQQLLRLVYRFIVLATLEERDLLHAHLSGPAAESARKTYGQGYSLRRLRQRSLRRSARDRHDDLWRSLRIVFRGLARGESRLGLPGLGGLYAATQCPDLDTALLDNAALLEAQYQLRWSRASGSLAAIDYRNMGTEELGSIYESLLELLPAIRLSERQFYFLGQDGDTTSTAGNARKTSGSHYTPDSPVQELVRSALDPLITQTLAANPSDPVSALLRLTVCDPACGSGHFLLAAARRLAEKIAELRAADGSATPADYRRALHEVISCCIHGVDRNPMALELARTALWLEGFEPGKPLSFLDHHLVCGDALLGLDRFSQMENGIPDAAFKPLSGDHAQTCKDLAKLNRSGRADLTALHKGEASLFTPGDREANAFAELAALDALPESDPESVEAKAAAYATFLEHARESRLARAADCFLGAFLATKNSGVPVPTTLTLLGEIASVTQHSSEAHELAVAHARRLCREAAVLHWPLAFPHVFARGGFDCILGNPPWERIKLQEEEFFASREPLIAAAKNKAERSKRIEWLSEGSLAYHVLNIPVEHGGNPAERRLHQEFLAERRRAEATSVYAHLEDDEGGRFPLSGVGDVNTYALFAETIERIRERFGRAGFIVPTGIATDDSTKAYFAHIAEGGRLARLIDFENREKIFPSIDSRIKFCLLTLGPAESAVFSFFLTQVSQLADERRSFALAPEDFALINPNTRTCPVFRSQADAELTRKIYRRVPVLIREARDDIPEFNPWGISFSTMFHMANDSHLFCDAPQPNDLPLYEAKMMHQFDHRWATYQGRRQKNEGGGGEVETADVSDSQKADPAFRITPRYWVPEREVLARIARAPKAVRDAFRSQDAAALLAATAVWIEAGHTLDLLGEMSATNARQRVVASGGRHFDTLPPKQPDWLSDKALAEARQCPALTDSELAQIRSSTDLQTALHHILDTRSPQWLMGWRDICRATDERTVIASVIPRAGVGNNLPLMLFAPHATARQCAALLGNLCSLVLDFVARHKVGGTHLNFFIYKQLPVLPPESYTEVELDFIVPRVLELTYTAEDLSGWAKDLGHHGEPFSYNSARRAQLRAELDARYACLYGMTREELEYILDPATTHGPDYPTVTFPGLKKNELAKYGEYRTRRLVLEAWDRENSTQ
jgi:methylase of polypeptide subunit release factors